jgi:hypothetical protein
MQGGLRGNIQAKGIELLRHPASSERFLLHLPNDSRKHPGRGYLRNVRLDGNQRFPAQDARRVAGEMARPRTSNFSGIRQEVKVSYFICQTIRGNTQAVGINPMYGSAGTNTFLLGSKAVRGDVQGKGIELLRHPTGTQRFFLHLPSDSWKHPSGGY